MELRIFSRDFEYLGIVEVFKSLTWGRKYDKRGVFTLVCPNTPDNLELLQVGNGIFKGADTEGGYITNRVLNQDDNGEEVMTVTGTFFTGIFSQRIIAETYSEKKTAEEIVYDLISPFGVPDSDRVLPYWAVDVSYPSDPINDLIQIERTYDNVLDTIENVLQTKGYGFMANFDIVNTRNIFKIYVGKDRTIESGNPVIFSKAFENVLSSEYTEGVENYKNVNYVLGDGEGADRRKVVLGTAKGLDRYEVYTDCRDIQPTKQNEDGTTTTLTDDELKALLTQEGLEKLNGYAKTLAFNSAINTNFENNLYTYREDYDVGDMVTIRAEEYGVILNVRISEVTEIYEENGYRLEVVFGNETLTITEKIKYMMK